MFLCMYVCLISITLCNFEEEQKNTAIDMNEPSQKGGDMKNRRESDYEFFKLISYVWYCWYCIINHSRLLCYEFLISVLLQLCRCACNDDLYPRHSQITCIFLTLCFVVKDIQQHEIPSTSFFCDTFVQTGLEK